MVHHLRWPRPRKPPGSRAIPGNRRPEQISLLADSINRRVTRQEDIRTVNLANQSGKRSCNRSGVQITNGIISDDQRTVKSARKSSLFAIEEDNRASPTEMPTSSSPLASATVRATPNGNRVAFTHRGLRTRPVNDTIRTHGCILRVRSVLIRDNDTHVSSLECCFRIDTGKTSFISPEKARINPQGASNMALTSSYERKVQPCRILDKTRPKLSTRDEVVGSSRSSESAPTLYERSAGPLGS